MIKKIKKHPLSCIFEHFYVTLLIRDMMFSQVSGHSFHSVMMFVFYFLLLFIFLITSLNEKNKHESKKKKTVPPQS